LAFDIMGRHSASRRETAFTLLEVLVAAMIVAILAALIIPNYQGIVLKAQEAVCKSHMRAIHVALANYLQDHQDIWPQGPYPRDKVAWETFWLATLKPYDISENTWQCPSLKRLLGDEDGYRLHYAPSMFDPTPGIARRWSRQPWLIERFGIHGQGPLICFPDGSIKSMARVLAEQGVQ
jgi:prepilin-type N-terminal cleavage/methylation domain-containing protein